MQLVKLSDKFEAASSTIGSMDRLFVTKSSPFGLKSELDSIQS